MEFHFTSWYVDSTFWRPYLTFVWPFLTLFSPFTEQSKPLHSIYLYQKHKKILDLSRRWWYRPPPKRSTQHNVNQLEVSNQWLANKRKTNRTWCWTKCSTQKSDRTKIRFGQKPGTDRPIYFNFYFFKNNSNTIWCFAKFFWWIYV